MSNKIIDFKSAKEESLDILDDKKNLRENQGLKLSKGTNRKKGSNLKINLDKNDFVKSKEEDEKPEVILFNTQKYKEHTYKFKITLYIFVCALLILFVFNLPVFSITKLNISGNKLLTSDEIANIIGFNANNNFFRLYFGNIDKVILESPKVKNCDIKYTFPNTLDINIDEVKVAGYLPYLEEFIYIDSEGKILEVDKLKKEGIPLILGLNFTKFVAGEKLEVDNPDSLDIIIELVNILNKYSILKDIISIDVENIADIRISTANVDIMIGEIENADYKVRTAIEILKQPTIKNGYLDVSGSNNRATFSKW